MSYRLLYPCDSLNAKIVDEDYGDEYEAARSHGRNVSLISTESLDQDKARIRPAPEQGDIVIYRGWMLTVPRYETLARTLEAFAASPLTSAEHYQLCHHLPRWYPHLTDLTTETIVLPRDCDFEAELAGVHWPGYFVKDYVKSLSTAGGSLVDDPSKIAGVVALIERYRGFIEGGVCVRRKESFLPDSERRYFVFKGRAYCASGEVPEVVHECASRIPSPFFSVDTAITQDGLIRIVEIGDGQVSARKEWTVERMMAILAS